MQLARYAALLALALLAAGCSAPAEDAETLTTSSPPTGGAASTPTSSAVQPVSVPSGSTGGTGTAPGSTGGSASSAALSPLVVELRIADARAFFAEGSAATLVVRGDPRADLRAGIALPAGVELVDGAVSYAGALEAGRPIELRSVLRAREAGEHVLRAWAEADVGLGSRLAPSALLSVAGDATSARFGSPAAPGPAFALSLEWSNATREALLTLSSDTTAAGRLAVRAPAGFGLTAGEAVEPLMLQAGGTLTRAWRLELPENGEGTQTWSVFLYPDAAVDGRLYSDSLYFVWHEGGWRVFETRPLDATVEGEGASPATGDGNASDTPATPVP